MNDSAKGPALSGLINSEFSKVPKSLTNDILGSQQLQHKQNI